MVAQIVLVSVGLLLCAAAVTSLVHTVRTSAAILSAAVFSIGVLVVMAGAALVAQR
jgi:formate/nitrite transporter FocA (FNT family)